MILGHHSDDLLAMGLNHTNDKPMSQYGSWITGHISIFRDSGGVTRRGCISIALPQPAWHMALVALVAAHHQRDVARIGLRIGWALFDIALK